MEQCAMGLTKQLITEAAARVRGTDGRDLVSSGALQWSTACDTYGSCRVHVEGAGPATLRAIGEALIAQVEDRARAVDGAGGGGARVDSFIVDFVDAHGTVVASVKSGGMKPVPAGAAGSAGAAGHTPIQGLGRSGANAGAAGGGGAGPVAPASGHASQGASPSPQGAAPAMPGVRHAIAVGAGKGGVGKSTVALNLAVGLARRGHSVGLLDADIYGPSMPTMLGLDALEPLAHRGMLQPFVVHGIRAITIGKLVDPDKPLIWRGPMAHGAFKQLAEQTEWGDLDYLIIDLPPGTGDISLTMSQVLRLTGAVVVCTPQKVAQDDAVRAAKMFQQLGVDVLGVVENMSAFIADDGKAYEIFGRGGAESMAQRLGVPFLGALPLTMSLRVNSDKGDPTANFVPPASDVAGTALKVSLGRMIDAFEGQVALASLRSGAVRPSLTIS
jgi:ATP-binding protein involved in chromosome partitioning